MKLYEQGFTQNKYLVFANFHFLRRGMGTRGGVQGMRPHQIHKTKILYRDLI